MRSEAGTVDEYIETLLTERREVIIWLREMLLGTVPGLEESMEFGMPTYRKGETYYAFASQKHHISLYVRDHGLIRQYSDRLGKVSLGKNCIRFRHLRDIDRGAVEELLSVSSR